MRAKLAAALIFHSASSGSTILRGRYEGKVQTNENSNEVVPSD
jgi:hypothetical protein